MYRFFKARNSTIFINSRNVLDGTLPYCFRDDYANYTLGLNFANKIIIIEPTKAQVNVSGQACITPNFVINFLLI